MWGRGGLEWVGCEQVGLGLSMGVGWSWKLQSVEEGAQGRPEWLGARLRWGSNDGNGLGNEDGWWRWGSRPLSLVEGLMSVGQGLVGSSREGVGRIGQGGERGWSRWGGTEAGQAKDGHR